MIKKILFSLVVISSFNLNVKAEDSDPVSLGILWGVGCVAGSLVGAAGIESYNRLSQDDTTTNTMDNTTTITNDRN